MNKKNMAKALGGKLSDWISSIDDEHVVDAIKRDAIVTGGALVSLLNGEEPNDYDVYFKTKESCLCVAQYYANKWNDMYPKKPHVDVIIDDSNINTKNFEGERITCFIRSVGMASEDEQSASEHFCAEDESNEEQKKPKYRPRFFSTNAISLSDKIQIVIRFYGPVDEIHKNYDYAHCTCSYDFHTGKVVLPEKALECIINKELYYVGSKYPLCSIIRSRKFINRGWHINAGQYLKMCMQLNELNLHDFNVFKDQLTGVDSYFFAQAIDGIEEKIKNDPDFKIENNYLFEIINRIF